MKSKNHHKRIILAGGLAVYFSIPLMVQPKICPTVVPTQEARFVMPHIAAPLQTALLSVLSMQQYPRCFAPISLAGQTQKGWPFVIAEPIRAQSYTAYTFWNRLFSGLATTACVLFAVTRIFKSRKELNK